MAGRKRGLITAGLRTCSTAPNIQKPHNHSAGNCRHIGAVWQSGEEFSVEWSGFRAEIQNRQLKNRAGQSGRSSIARKTVQVAVSQPFAKAELSAPFVRLSCCSA